MIIRDVAMLAGDTARSAVYLQVLVRAGLFPKHCIVFGSENSKSQPPARDGEALCGINLREKVTDTLSRAGISYEITDEKDINSPKMAELISSLSQRYIIYSGYGGAILKEHLFHLGKKYLHVHAGMLPRYRGSTTAYYSILRESFIGATAIFLNERLDQGDIICQKSFPLPDFSVDIDYVYEPWVRAEVLKEALRKYLEDGEKFSAVPQSHEGAETYYIIHPVLKHLAMRKVCLARREVLLRNFISKRQLTAGYGSQEEYFLKDGTMRIKG